MANLGDLQKRMTAIFAEAKAQNIKPLDVIPAEVQAHFQDIKELKDARVYVKEVESRENALKAKNEGLEKELKIAKQAVEDLLDDHKQDMVDLKQSQNSVQFYKNLMEGAEARSNNYQSKWQDMLNKQSVAIDKDKRIEGLETELYNHKASMMKLVDENKKMNDIFETLRHKDLEKLEDNELKLMEMERLLKEAEEYRKVVEEESEEFEQVYTGLLEKIDHVTLDSAKALNQATEQNRQADQLRYATLSEVAPLSRFYDRCFDIMLILFQQILATDKQSVIYLPETLDANLKAAMKEYEQYFVMHDAMQMEGIREDQVRNRISHMGRSAGRMSNFLRAIARDVDRLLKTQKRRPDVWMLVRTKFGKSVR